MRRSKRDVTPVCSELASRTAIESTMDDLVVASHGRGVWILDDLRAVRSFLRRPAHAVTLVPPRDAYRMYDGQETNVFKICDLTRQSLYRAERRLWSAHYVFVTRSQKTSAPRNRRLAWPNRAALCGQGRSTRISRTSLDVLARLSASKYAPPNEAQVREIARLRGTYGELSVSRKDARGRWRGESHDCPLPASGILNFRIDDR